MAHPGGRAGGRGGRWSRHQAITEAKIRERASPHPMGPRRVTLAAGLLNALSVINLAKADQQQQTIIARQDKLLAIVNKPSIAKQKDMWGQLLNMYTTPDQLLPEIAACVWFKAKKSEKCLAQSDDSHVEPAASGLGFHSHSAHVRGSAVARWAFTWRTTSESTVAGAHRAMRPFPLPQCVFNSARNAGGNHSTAICNGQLFSRSFVARRPCDGFLDTALNVRVIINIYNIYIYIYKYVSISSLFLFLSLSLFLSFCLIVHRLDTVALLRICFPCFQTCQTHLTILPTNCI